MLLQGRLTLLLGPPSSGKSSLLRALAGKLHDGKLRINGEVRFMIHTGYLAALFPRLLFLIHGCTPSDQHLAPCTSTCYVATRSLPCGTGVIQWCAAQGLYAAARGILHPSE